ncbi:MAG: TRAP transporter small permease subunit, partial [Bosea sp.]|nr:TRAP transporter small permease subunit [Bosea sp. (in: a-proteobacteria)]
IFVDTFTLKLPRRWRAGLDALWDVVYGLAMALIAWRLGVGARSAFVSGENTMVLQLPSYLPIAVCAVLAGFVALAAFVSASRLMRQSR